MQITMPNMPETLTYAVLASLGIDLITALLLAVRSDWLGVVLMLAVAGGGFWFLCRRLITMVPASGAAAAGTVLLLLCALTDFASGHPYYGLLFIVATVALGFVFLLLQQGATPAELRVGGIVAVDMSATAAYLQMLDTLREAGVLTAEEHATKRAALGG